MGIDVYLKWKGMTEDDRDAQITGFSTTHGHVGYLREAYHGEPYATRHLLPEAFESEDGSAKIAASVLRERLPHTLELAEKRERTIYKGSDEDVQACCKSFSDFVELCERKEAETGEPMTIVASY